MKITPQALLDLGFIEHTRYFELDKIRVYKKDGQVICCWTNTNAKSIEDIKELIRLFK